MSLDGFLTFFGLLVAGFALLGPITRLKIQLDAPFQWSIGVLAFFAIMAFEFIQPIIGVLPESNALWVVELEFGQPTDLLTNSHIAFFIAVTWVIATTSLYKFSRPSTRKLKRLLPLVERLQDENRALELVTLVEPYLPALERSYLQDRAEAATAIVDSLSKSPGVRKVLQMGKPKFAAKFFSTFHGSHYQWLDKYIAESMENKDSHLRNDIRETNNTTSVTYYLEPKNHVLFSLINSTKFAEDIGIWSPVGDTVTKMMREDRSYQLCLNEAPPQADKDLFDDITYSAIHFFDILITRTAVQGHMDHMWMMYLEYFVDALVALPVSTAKPVAGGGEFDSLKERLIYEAQSRLSDWVALAIRLPDENAHRQPRTKQEAIDAVAIPIWAAETLCNVLRAVLMSDNLSQDFKDDRLNSFVHLAARRVGSNSYLLEVLANGIVHGSWDVPQKNLSSVILNMKPSLDETHLFEFPEMMKLCEAPRG